MKRVLNSIIVASLLMSTMIPFVSADETTTTTAPRLEMNRPGPLKGFNQERWQVVQNFYHAMKERFEFAVKRMTEIADRMQTKADEFEAKGADTKAVEQKIADAKAKLGEVNALIDTATKNFQAIHNAEDRKAAFATFRESVKKVREALRAAHGLLKEAAHGLREIHKSLMPAKETTDTNS